MRLLATILAVSCLAAMPPMPRRSTILRSPKDAENYTVKPIKPVVVRLPLIMAVTFELTNAPNDSASTMQTGISASTNLIDWQVVFSTQYVTKSTVTLIRPYQQEFYRGFHS